ncbi:DUF5134 domain-containing protein [Streptomyces sp. NPDC014986]|uniref:DUF5134 domain-containing protein n=1 Tax=Streptomyces sp. NPDC014986 TaxID=3364934 RepID=UPI0036FF75E0
MRGPVSSGWLLVALCAAVGAYCLLRMRSRVEEQRRAAGGEALMGFGMAVMAVPAAAFTLPAWVWPACAAVFGAAGLHALWTARAGARHLHHPVEAGTMVYMGVTMAASPGHGGGPGQGHGPGPPGIPLLTGALLLYFVAYVLVTGARLVPVAAVAPGGRGAGWRDRPELARACRLSMALATVAMLLTM